MGVCVCSPLNTYIVYLSYADDLRQPRTRKTLTQATAAAFTLLPTYLFLIFLFYSSATITAKTSPTTTTTATTLLRIQNCKFRFERVAVFFLFSVFRFLFHWFLRAKIKKEEEIIIIIAKKWKVMYKKHKSLHIKLLQYTWRVFK